MTKLVDVITMIELIKNWRNARYNILNYDFGDPSKEEKERQEMWSELSKAEHALMDLAKELS